MKSDINLLQKRKSQKYSAQKWAMILLGIALFAGAVYAGFTIPANARMATQLTLTELRGELLNVSGTEEDLAVLSSEYAQRKEQLDALTAIDEAKTDMGEYIDAIEAAIPTTANISYLNAAEEMISLTGVAQDDNEIAAFCLHLRESGMFSDVFLVSSTLTSDGTTAFSIQLTLPVTLDSSAVLPETTEEAETAEEVSQ